MKDIKGPGDFLAWLGGAELRVLAQVPTERTRYIQMAIVLLTTAGIGTLSMMFALHDGVHLSLWVAVIGGFTWGFIVLNLDRFLVVTMGHARGWKRLLGMALPRFALAIVISLVVATPLSLRIFAHDINNQMVQQQATESASVAKQQAQSGPSVQANALAAKINTDKQIMAGHLQGTVSNPNVTYWQGQVDALTPKVADAQTKMDTAQAAYQCEVDGSGPNCVGASNVQGNGPMAQLKQTEYQQAKKNYDTLNGQLTTANSNLEKAKSDALKSSGETLQQQQQEAQQELPGLQKQYNDLENQLKKNEQDAQGAVQDNNGILAQLQDLSDAGAKDPILGVAEWVVTLLFFCIEILPVSIKVLMNMGPLSLYEQVLKTEEDIAADKARQRRVVARQDAEREANKQIAIAEHMRQLEEDLGKRANQHVATHMGAILDVALQEWSRQVQTKLGVQVPPGTLSQATSAGAAAPTGLTGPQPRLSITAPQSVIPPSAAQAPGGPGTTHVSGMPTVSSAPAGPGAQAGQNGYHGMNGANGANGIGYQPTVTFFPPSGGGHGYLPAENADDEDGL